MHQCYLSAIFAISHGRPPTHAAFDNDECHVTASRPISEAAHSRSYDKAYLSAIAVTYLSRSFNLQDGGNQLA